MLLRPAAVWTGEDDALHAGWVVLVRGERIEAVGPGAAVAAAAAGGRTVELPGLTLTPGLMDLHSHVFLHPYNEMPWDDQVLREPLGYRAARAVASARAALDAGFTTYRDLGTEGAGYADVGLRRAIAEGIVPGPRLFVAGRAIVAFGGYGPARRNYPGAGELPQGAQEVSGVEEIVRAVREQAANGVDWIKLYADYRTGPNGEAGPTLSQDELNAAVATAHDLHRRVAVHATTDEGVRRAVTAGADTIEHGYGATEATFRLMLARGTAYLPTLTAPEATATYAGRYTPGGPPSESMQTAERAFRMALRLGVRIGLGSDVGVFAHGTSWRELEAMVRNGMSPLQALRAATVVNAQILGRDDLGVIRPHALADLIAVPGDPTRDATVFRRVAFVMASGRIHRFPPAAAPVSTPAAADGGY